MCSAVTAPAVSCPVGALQRAGRCVAQLRGGVQFSQSRDENWYKHSSQIRTPICLVDWGNTSQRRCITKHIRSAPVILLKGGGGGKGMWVVARWVAVHLPRLVDSRRSASGWRGIS